MGRKPVVIGALACVIFGIGLGSATDDSEPTPEVKIIRIPEVKTHVEYRTAPPVVTPLPDECYRAFELISVLDEYNDQITQSAGDILLELDQLGKVSVMDPQHINPVITEVRASKSSLDEAAVERLETLSTAQLNIKNCTDALGQ